MNFEKQMNRVKRIRNGENSILWLTRKMELKSCIKHRCSKSYPDLKIELDKRTNELQMQKLIKLNLKQI